MQGLLLSRQGLNKETKIHKSKYNQGSHINIEPQYQGFAVGLGCPTNVQIPPLSFEIYALVMLKHAVTEKQADLTQYPEDVWQGRTTAHCYQRLNESSHQSLSLQKAEGWDRLLVCFHIQTEVLFYNCSLRKLAVS